MTRLRLHARNIGLVAFALIILLLTCALGGCRAHRDTATANPRAEGTDLHGHRPLHAEPYTVDSVVVKPHRSVVDKALGQPAKVTTHQPSSTGVPTHIGKKSTVSVYYGPATVTTTNTAKKGTTLGPGATQVVAGKKSQAAAADSGASVQVATAKQQAAAGQGISQQATTTKPGFWQAALPALGVLGGIGLMYWLVAGGGMVVLAGAFRRKSTDKQA